MSSQLRIRSLLLSLLCMTLVAGCSFLSGSNESSNGTASATSQTITEDSLQKSTGVNGELPKPEYTYDAILQSPAGAVRPNQYGYQDVNNGTVGQAKYKAAVVEALKYY